MPRRTYAWPIPKGTTLCTYSISKRQLGTYQPNIPTTSPLTNVKVTKEIKEKGMIQNLKITITSWVVLLRHTLKILQQTETPPLLAEELA